MMAQRGGATVDILPPVPLRAYAYIQLQNEQNKLIIFIFFKITVDPPRTRFMFRQNGTDKTAQSYH